MTGGAVLPDLALARKVLRTEAAAILALVDRLDDRFARAVVMLRDCQGRVIRLDGVVALLLVLESGLPCSTVRRRRH